MSELIAFISKFATSLLSWFVQQKWKSRRLSSPIEISVEQFVDDYWTVAFPDKFPDLAIIDGISMTDKKAYAILLKHGAVDVNQTRLRIRLRAQGDFPVLIKAISIETEKCALLSGTRIICPSAGANDAIVLTTDLDENSPSIWEAQEKDFEVTSTGSHPYFSRKSITLTKDEYETLILIGKTSRNCVSWKIRIEFETNGHSGYSLIDSKGMPFRTTGESLKGYTTDLEWAWYNGHRLIPVQKIDG